MMESARARKLQHAWINMDAGLARWSEEQCRVVRTTSWTRPGFEQGKDDLGLREYQTKMWPGWMRHATLVMLAHGFLISFSVHGWKEGGAGERPADAFGRRASA
jgi:SRSO17 transposase